jgi:hypothetical protein
MGDEGNHSTLSLPLAYFRRRHLQSIAAKLVPLRTEGNSEY